MSNAQFLAGLLRHLRLPLLLVVFCVAFASTRDNAVAAPGDLDESFGTGGKVTSPIGVGGDFATALALQADGKIVVAGNCEDAAGSSDFCLARYQPTGVLDVGFGSGGKVINPVGALDDRVLAMALQSDGKIVIVGVCDTGANSSAVCLARYATTGVLDAGFGSGGRVITDLGGQGVGRAVALQADGKIVVAGSCQDATDASYFCLLRYRSTGVLDASFGTGGKVISSIGASHDTASAMALQTDGKIVVAGSCENASSYRDFCLARYRSTGVLDASFGTGGKVITPSSTGVNSVLFEMVLQVDGKVVVAGHCQSDTDASYFCLARYRSTGVLDASFGTGGKVVTAAGIIPQAMALQPDGKIVVAGGCDDSSGNVYYCLARYGSTGILDPSFGTGVRVVTVFPVAIALQSDGKIVAACGGIDFCLARFQGGGEASPSESRDIIFIQGINSQSTCGSNFPVSWIKDYLTQSAWVSSRVQIRNTLYFSYSAYCSDSLSFGLPQYSSEDTCHGIADAATKLKSFIANRSVYTYPQQPSPRVTIYAHSMGGVVAAYLVATESQWASQNIASVITFDSPLHGVDEFRLAALDVGTACERSSANHSQSVYDLAQGSQIISTILNARPSVASSVPFYTTDAIRNEVLPGTSTLTEAVLAESTTLQGERMHIPTNDTHGSSWSERSLVKEVFAACGLLIAQSNNDCYGNLWRGRN